MATITVRVSDEVRDALQSRAEAERQTLSDFVRDRLEDSVYDFPGRTERDPASEIKSLTTMERRTLSLLHRILARVLPEDANGVDGDEQYQLERATVLEQGLTREYQTEFTGIEPELTIQQCEFVMEVLDMFRITKYSIEDLQKKGEQFTDDLRDALTFRGFDHNDDLEGQMSEYVRYLVSDDRWAEQKELVHGRERGNSHMPMRASYSRMLTSFRETQQSRQAHPYYLLLKDELTQIADARVHPSRR